MKDESINSYKIIDYLKSRYSFNFSNLTSERSLFMIYVCAVSINEVCSKFNLTSDELSDIITKEVKIKNR